MTAYGMRFVDEARRGLRGRFDGQFRDNLHWYFETRRAGGNRTLCQTMTSVHTARDCDGSLASGSPRSTRSG